MGALDQVLWIDLAGPYFYVTTVDRIPRDVDLTKHAIFWSTGKEVRRLTQVGQNKVWRIVPETLCDGDI